MSPELFLNKRQNKTFTATEIMYFLHEQGYRFRLIDTLIPNKGYREFNSTKGYSCVCWPRKQKGSYCNDLCNAMESFGIPKHFAYIKFYADHGYEENADDAASHIRALVAGRTTRSINNDFQFAMLQSLKGQPSDVIDDVALEPKGDKAKKWLHQKNVRWYHEKVLIIWSPKAEQEEDESKVKNLAESVETDIGGLFGLFES